MGNWLDKFSQLYGHAKKIAIEWGTTKQKVGETKQQVDPKILKIQSNHVVKMAKISEVRKERYLQAQLAVLAHCKDTNLSVEDICAASSLTALTLKDELDDGEKALLRNIVLSMMERKYNMVKGAGNTDGSNDSSTQVKAIQYQEELH